MRTRDRLVVGPNSSLGAGRVWQTQSIPVHQRIFERSFQDFDRRHACSELEKALRHILPSSTFHRNCTQYDLG
jgi:hypothetical protein